jgi:type IV pilus assembly protein PilQ
MKTPETDAMIRNLLLSAAAAAVAMSAPAFAAELNNLSALKVLKTPGGAQVVVEGNRAPTFTVFRLNEPDRLVVDLSGADASGIKGHHDGSGPVSGVVASQFADDKASVGRVLIALDKATRYDVHADGNRIVVSIDGEAKAAATPSAAAEPAAVADAAAVPASAPVEAAHPNEAGMVASKLDEAKVKNPAGKLTGLSYAHGQLKVVADGEVAKFELIELANPPRLAVDLYDLKSTAKAKNVGGGLLRGVRIGSWPEKVRLVLDIEGDMPTYTATRNAHGLSIALEQKKAELTDAAIEIDGKPVAMDAAPAPVAHKQAVTLSSAAEVKDVGFEESSAGGRIELKLIGESAWKVERPDGRSAVLTLESARIPKRLERSLDTSALDTPVKMVSAFAAPGGGERVRVVVAASGEFDETVVKTAQGLSWKLALKGVKAEEAQVTARSAGFSEEATQYAEKGAPQRGYVGKRVSFEFKDIEIHNLLRIIAEISKKNIVVADDVSGKVTIRLRNVPWDQALELILRSKGLGQEDLGNIIRVAPLTTLENEAKARAERKKNAVVAADLVVQLIPVNYASADSLSGRVKDVLSERGNVAVDPRTNTLIVRDIATNMGKIRSMVATLDTQTPQVLIESRIIEANTRLAREVGIQWGGNAQFAPSTNNSTGLAFPNSVRVAGAAGNQATDGTSQTPNYAVNLPVGIGFGSGGGLGFVFGSAGGALQLNLRLSALESQGAVKTISAPKVTTLDNNTARISQGLSIPFSQVSAGGTNTAFVEARLSLEVTPHITADGSVLMNIKAENNQPDPANTGSNGQPAIQKKEASTQVLVKDADTTVIGGIYVRASSTTQNGVPILSKIPILGYFFKNYRELETRSELLIFITPRILNRPAVAQNP